MGTTSTYKLNLVGGDEAERKLVFLEMDRIEKEAGGIGDCPTLSEEDNKWSQASKWTPEEILQKASLVCKKSYILLTTVSFYVDNNPLTETIYFQGIGINALHPTLRKNIPLTSVKKTAKELKDRNRDT